MMEYCKEYFSQDYENKIQDIAKNGNDIGYHPPGKHKKGFGIEVKESFTYRTGELSVNLDYDDYIKEVSDYAKKIFKLIIRSLRKDPKIYDNTVSPSFDTLLLIHYPEEQNTNGVAPHTDWGYLTLLLTTNKGLQVKINNEWIDVPFIEDHFVVNIGDILEILSSGFYKSTEHRVIVEKEKYSIALFFEPKIDELIEPIEINDKYKPVTYSNLIEKHFKYEEGLMESKKL